MPGLQVLAILPVMEIKKRICLQDTRKIAMVLKSTGDRCLLGLLRGDLHFPGGASRPIGSHGSLPNADSCYLQAGKSPPSQCSTPQSTRVLHCTHLRSCRAAPLGIDGHIKFSTKAHHNLTLSLPFRCSSNILVILRLILILIVRWRPPLALVPGLLLHTHTQYGK